MTKRMMQKEINVERVLEIRKTKKTQESKQKRKPLSEGGHEKSGRKVGWIPFHVLKQRGMFHSHF